MPSCFRLMPGGGRGGHGAHTGTGSAIDHIDSRDLRLRLDKHAAGLGQVCGHVFGDLALRGDGIAKETVTAGADSRLGDGFITFPKFLFHG